MSFRALLDRTVTIVPRIVTGTDDRGNDVVTDGTLITGVPAGRDLEGADEDLDDRDRQTQRWIYFLPPAADDGTVLELSGYDRIIDGAETFEVDGEPEVIVRRLGGKRHHIEAKVYRVAG